MNRSEIDELIRAVLTDDLDPPSDDYDLYEYAATLAHQLDPHSATYAVNSSLKILPANLAETFLNGLLDGCTVNSLGEALLSALPHVNELSSASVVVHLLLYRLQMDRSDIVRHLLQKLASITKGNEQDIYSYALLATVTFERQQTLPAHDREHDEEIENLVSAFPTSHLTDYGRIIFERIKKDRRR